MADTPVGKTVNVDLLRKGQKETLHVTIAKLEDTDTGAPDAKTAPHPAAPAKPNSKLSQLGLSLGLLDGDARTKYKVSADVQGVVVTEVDPESPAGEKNFRPGDVIVEVQSQSVHTPDDVTKRVEADAKAGKKVELLLVSRDGNLTFVALRLGDAG